MKINMAICLERFDGQWSAEAPIIRNTRQEIDDTVREMLDLCVSESDCNAGYESDVDGYDFIFWRQEGQEPREVAQRYKIVEMEVPYV